MFIVPQFKYMMEKFFEIPHLPKLCYGSHCIENFSNTLFFIFQLYHSKSNMKLHSTNRLFSCFRFHFPHLLLNFQRILSLLVISKWTGNFQGWTNFNSLTKNYISGWFSPIKNCSFHPTWNYKTIMKVSNCVVNCLV